MWKGGSLDHLHIGTKYGENRGYSHVAGSRGLGDFTLLLGHSLWYDNPTMLKSGNTLYLFAIPTLSA